MRIGAFSKYVKTTVKTLRYYDRVGLFCPAETDPVTGYRNYTVDQLKDFEQIRQYRTAGLSVEQIGRLLAGENLKKVLHEQQNELTKQEELLRRKKRAVAQLSHATPTNFYTVQLKEMPTYTVCTCSIRVPDATHIAAAASACLGDMKQIYPTLTFAHPSYCCVTFTDTSHHDTDIEIEYSEAVTSSQQDRNGFVFKTLIGGMVACVEHRGSYESIASAYAALLRWIAESGYQMAGAVRERFVHGSWDRKDEAEWLVEIQVPLYKQGGTL